MGKKMRRKNKRVNKDKDEKWHLQKETLEKAFLWRKIGTL